MTGVAQAYNITNSHNHTRRLPAFGFKKCPTSYSEHICIHIHIYMSKELFYIFSCSAFNYLYQKSLPTLHLIGKM